MMKLPGWWLAVLLWIALIQLIPAFETMKATIQYLTQSRFTAMALIVIAWTIIIAIARAIL